MCGFAVEMFAGGCGLCDGLDFIPQLAGDGGRTIIFNDQIAEAQCANVDGIGEKRDVPFYLINSLVTYT